MRDGRHIADEGDAEARGLQRTKRALATGAGALHEHRDRAHAVLHRTTSSLFGRELRRERRALTRTLEATRTGRRPGDGVAVDVRDGHHGVVERALDMRDTRRDVLLDLLLLRLLALGGRALRSRAHVRSSLAFHFLADAP